MHVRVEKYLGTAMPETLYPRLDGQMAAGVGAGMDTRIDTPGTIVAFEGLRPPRACRRAAEDTGGAAVLRGRPRSANSAPSTAPRRASGHWGSFPLAA